MGYQPGDEYMVTEGGSRFHMWALVIVGVITAVLGLMAGTWLGALIGLGALGIGIFAHTSFMRNGEVTGISALVCTAFIAAIIICLLSF